MMNRRGFLKKGLWATSGLALGAGFARYGVLKSIPYSKRRVIPGKLLGPNASAGHLLRDSSALLATSSPRSVEKIGTLIIGGGIAGLSAAWWLRREGYTDFILTELEDHVGGNSTSGKNHISAYPWGAHYLPLPHLEMKYVLELLEELKVIQGYDKAGRPIYDEYFLCADPLERLFFQGHWQDGLIPQRGITQTDRQQYDLFFKKMEDFKRAKGSDGLKVFQIPVEKSSRDPKWLKLDRITMAEFMDQEGLNSAPLRWYVNYCCRDDYGMSLDQVSAWAGVHYFASRTGVASNADSQAILTWPEGNGWLVSSLKEKVKNHIRTSSLIYSVKNNENQIWVDCMDLITKEPKRFQCEQVIFAGPRFVASKVIQGLMGNSDLNLKELHYSPWMVANVTLHSYPQGVGAPVSWDNVSYYGDSVGYILATHQNLSVFRDKTVLTYYHPLTQQSPVLARRQAFEKTHAHWAGEIVSDLEKMHPGIGSEVENIDVWVWGHGMIAPKVGYLWGETRRKMLESFGNIHFAHSDMSGISIFEEAQYRGVQAALKVLSHFHRRKASA